MFIKDGRDIINFKNYILNESGLYRLRTNPRVLNWCSGRLYTPFVQLSSAVRRDYLYFDSQLTSLDIKRSFPLWLVVWLLENGIEMDYETKCFISAVRSGNIYPDLIKKFNNNKNLFNNTEFDKPYIDKFEVKKHFGIWLNGNNDRNNLTNLIFRTYYPNIFDFVNQYKTGDKDKMYHTLVKLETDFIFNHVCRRLYYEIPDLQLLTCHDEVYFEGRYKQAVEQIWNQELEKVYQKITVGGNSDFDIDENENDFDSDSDFDFGSESLM